MKPEYLVTVGTFDGVHLGHLKLLAALKSAARRKGLKTLVALFDAPPKSFFHPGSAPLLSTAQERRDLLRAVGIDAVKILRFNARLAKVSCSRFFSEFLLRRCRARGIIVGRDFAFGRGRQGNIRTLGAACRRRGIFFAAAPLVREGEAKVSSSRVRELLLHGRIEEASKLLGRPYCVSGTVLRGRGLGAELGVPTANLDIDPKLLLPRGVFAVRVRGGPFRTPRAAVCNVGTRPTIDACGRIEPSTRRRFDTSRTTPFGCSGRSLSMEVHIPGHAGELYGRRLKVEFLRFLRPEKRFPSVKALLRQIRSDIAAALRP
ncbi:MAG: bifunctional riboflavin kinase/FMN adenylyltransferase [Elusimicrobia bacterium]|nr:bifunctional riboflavin kinase/FMN adenylyltransferase [Elusimicrobiota bacterium]